MSGRAAPRREEARRRAARTTGVRILATRVHVPTGVVMAPRLTVGIASILVVGVVRSRSRPDHEDIHQLLPADAHHLLAHHERVGLYRDGFHPLQLHLRAGRRSAGHLQRDRELDEPARVLLLGRQRLLAPDGTYHLFADRWAGSSGFNPGWEFRSRSTPSGHERARALHRQRIRLQQLELRERPAPRPQQPSGRAAERHVCDDCQRGRAVHDLHRDILERSLDPLLRLARIRAECSLGVRRKQQLRLQRQPGGPTGRQLRDRPAPRTHRAQHQRRLWSLQGAATHEHLSIQRGHPLPVQRQHLPQQDRTFRSHGALDASSRPTASPRIRSSGTAGGSTMSSTIIPDDRVGYHLTSTDGIHNWTDQGLAYDPALRAADLQLHGRHGRPLVQDGTAQPPPRERTYHPCDLRRERRGQEQPDLRRHGPRQQGHRHPLRRRDFDKDTGVGTGGAGGGGGGAGGGGAGGALAGTGGTAGSSARGGSGGGVAGAGGRAATGGVGGGSSGGHGGSGTGGSIGTGGVQGTGGSGTGGITAGSGGTSGGGGNPSTGTGGASVTGSGGETGTDGGSAGEG